ncbi:hypothetical protein [Gemmatimonas sp.]|uniref:hypothetical protein n=1 Tax=Gemmatimonas sp. TaxID=1962908 RepID=UPI0039836D49
MSARKKPKGAKKMTPAEKRKATLARNRRAAERAAAREFARRSEAAKRGAETRRKNREREAREEKKREREAKALAEVRRVENAKKNAKKTSKKTSKVEQLQREVAALKKKLEEQTKALKQPAKQPAKTEADIARERAEAIRRQEEEVRKRFPPPKPEPTKPRKPAEPMEALAEEFNELLVDAITKGKLRHPTNFGTLVEGRVGPNHKWREKGDDNLDRLVGSASHSAKMGRLGKLTPSSIEEISYEINALAASLLHEARRRGWQRPDIHARMQVVTLGSGDGDERYGYDAKPIATRGGAVARRRYLPTGLAGSLEVFDFLLGRVLHAALGTKTLIVHIHDVLVWVTDRQETATS